MRLGSQRMLAKELKCSPGYISKLVKKNDYRIVKVGDKIDLDETVKRMADSSFGQRSGLYRLRKKTKKAEKATNKIPMTEPNLEELNSNRARWSKEPEGDHCWNDEIPVKEYLVDDDLYELVYPYTNRKLVAAVLNTYLFDFENGHQDCSEQVIKDCIIQLLDEYFGAVRAYQDNKPVDKKKLENWEVKWEKHFRKTDQN